MSEPDDSPYREVDPMEFPSVVGLLELDLHLPGCQSLKQKRGMVAKIKNHLRKKHSLSVAETAYLDKWSRAGLVATAVSSERNVVENVLQATVHTVEKDSEVQLLQYSIQLI